MKLWASQVAQSLRIAPLMQETQEMWVLSLVGKIPWRRKWQPALIFLLGKVPWTEDLGELQFMRLQRVGRDLEIERAHTHESLYVVFWCL